MPRSTRDITIRPDRDDGHARLERLAALDSKPVPTREMLLAEVNGEPQAAIEIATGATSTPSFAAADGSSAGGPR